MSNPYMDEHEQQPLTGRASLQASERSANSVLSYSKLDKTQQEKRTQSYFQAEINLFKTFVGIGLVAFPQTMSWVGVGLGSISLIFLGCMSLISGWFLIKARNRYPNREINDLCDMGEVVYGSKMRIYCQVILIVN